MEFHKMVIVDELFAYFFIDLVEQKVVFLLFCLILLDEHHF